MIERVARALIERQIRANRKWDTTPAELEALLPRAIDYAWRDREADARAVIEAMREPTAPMLSAARTAPSDLVWRDSLTAQMEADAASKYRAMIDAALNPQTPA